MTEFMREHGRYSRTVPAPAPAAVKTPLDPRLEKRGRRPAGSVVPWADEKADLPEILGDEDIVRNTIGGIDAWAYAFLWHCVESF